MTICITVLLCLPQSPNFSSIDILGACPLFSMSARYQAFLSEAMTRLNIFVFVLFFSYLLSSVSVFFLVLYFAAPGYDIQCGSVSSWIPSIHSLFSSSSFKIIAASSMNIGQWLTILTYDSNVHMWDFAICVFNLSTNSKEGSSLAVLLELSQFKITNGLEFDH